MQYQMSSVSPFFSQCCTVHMWQQWHEITYKCITLLHKKGEQWKSLCRLYKISVAFFSFACTFTQTTLLAFTYPVKGSVVQPGSCQKGEDEHNMHTQTAFALCSLIWIQQKLHTLHQWLSHWKITTSNHIQTIIHGTVMKDQCFKLFQICNNCIWRLNQYKIINWAW